MPRLTGTSATRSTGTGSSRQRDIGPPPAAQWEHYATGSRRRAEIEPRTNTTRRWQLDVTNASVFSDMLLAEYRASVQAARSGSTRINDYDLSEVARQLAEGVYTVSDTNITPECEAMVTAVPEETYEVVQDPPRVQQEEVAAPIANNIPSLFRHNLGRDYCGINPRELDIYIKDSLNNGGYYDLSSETLSKLVGKLCAITLHPRSNYFSYQLTSTTNSLVRVVITRDLAEWARSLNWTEGFDEYAEEDTDSYTEISFADGYVNTYHQYDLAVHVIPESLIGDPSILEIPDRIECTACCNFINKASGKLNDKEYYECSNCGTIHIVGEGILYA